MLKSLESYLQKLFSTNKKIEEAKILDNKTSIKCSFLDVDDDIQFDWVYNPSNIDNFVELVFCTFTADMSEVLANAMISTGAKYDIIVGNRILSELNTESAQKKSIDNAFIHPLTVVSRLAGVNQ